ncbi:hypothetical protein [Microbacterium oxydans]|uniref:hypothetical protein n=1 Tax=Microbacterium oxydans TaxID=82380 RepID=UPI000FDC98CE|nr:hypothetical protein [Microbacterium oxydans]
MDTDFWGVVIPNWIAATGGLLGTLLAVVSLIVALRARGTADRAVANDAETREAVAIVAKPATPVPGTASATLPPLSAQTEGNATPPPARSPEDQATLERILGTLYPSNSHKSRGKTVHKHDQP